jgi:hypothetical protein
MGYLVKQALKLMAAMTTINQLDVWPVGRRMRGAVNLLAHAKET